MGPSGIKGAPFNHIYPPRRAAPKKGPKKPTREEEREKHQRKIGPPKEPPKKPGAQFPGKKRGKTWVNG